MVPDEHTLYEILEANDMAAVEKALIRMTLWGNARLIPVVSMDQIGESGKLTTSDTESLPLWRSAFF